MNQISRSLCILFVAVISVSGQIDSISYEQYRSYDSLRIRTISDPQKARRGYPMSIQGNVYQKSEARSIMANKRPSIGKNLESAHAQIGARRSLLITYGIGTIAGFSLLDEGKIGFPLLATATISGITGVILLNRTYANFDVYASQFEQQLRREFNIQFTLSPDTIVNHHYQEYIASTVRFSSNYSRDDRNLTPLIIDGTALSHRGWNHAEIVAIKYELPESARLFHKAGSLHKIGTIPLLSGVMLIGGGGITTMAGLFAMMMSGLSGGSGNFPEKTVTALFVSGGVLLSSGIVISIQAPKTMNKGLITYDKELRKKYDILPFEYEE